MRKILSLLVFTFAIVFIAFSFQGNHSRKNNLKKINVEVDDTLPHTDITKWVGKKIIFLREFNSKIDYDYVSFTGGSGYKGRPIYSDCYDHEALVESVIPDSLGEYNVKVKMLDKSKKEYVGHTTNGSLSRVALVEDVEKAERFLIGKIYWMKVDYWYFLDEDKEQMILKYGHRFKKVRVTRFTVSMDDNALYEITLTDEMGETGVLNVNLNNNNVERSMLNNSLLSKYFFKNDIHKMYNWENEIWRDVMNKQIYKGMTQEQAILSWGDPDEIMDLQNGVKKFKYNSGGSFTIKDGKVLDVRQ